MFLRTIIKNTLILFILFFLSTFLFANQELIVRAFLNPDNVKYYIYSNIPINNAIVNIVSDYNITLRSQNVNLTKGWNAVLFEDFYYGAIQNNIDACHVEVTANGVANETYTLNSTTNYTYNNETDCYENSDIEFCFDNKLLHPGWNWESFPKLDRENNNPVLAVPIFMSMIPNDFTKFESLGNFGYLQKNNTSWHNADANLKSSDGEKFQFLPPNNRIYIATGTVLSPTTTISLNAGWYWIGYWLPHSEMIDVAFGDNWDKVEKIKSENWYFDKMENERGVTDPEILPSAKLKPLHYGEGYYVYLKAGIPNFQWHLDQTSRSKNYVKKEPDNFSYTKKADYEVIDVVDIDPEIQEIGVFENDVCVGGVKVDENSEQILVYSDRMNRNESEFTFEVVTGRSNKIVSNYKVYEKNTGIFTDNHIIPGHQEYSIVKLVKRENLHPEINKILKHSCYPNPFKLSGSSRSLGTTISFELPKAENVKISIFNIKGQKVKTLKNELLSKGVHSVIWTGKDDNSNNVGSGIYFYQIKTINESVISKLLMLK